MHVDPLLANVMHQAIPNDDVIGGFDEDPLIQVGYFKPVEDDVAAVVDFYSAGVYARTYQHNLLVIVILNGGRLYSRAARASYIGAFVVCTRPDVENAPGPQLANSMSYRAPGRIDTA